MPSFRENPNYNKNIIVSDALGKSFTSIATGQVKAAHILVKLSSELSKSSSYSHTNALAGNVLFI